MYDEYIIESISVEDLQVDNAVFTGMRISGIGLIMTIGVLVVLKILRNA